jgi:integrase
MAAKDKLTIEDFYKELARGGASGKKPCAPITINKGYKSMVSCLLKSVGLPKDAAISEMMVIPNEQWHKYLDKYTGAAHNTRLIYVKVLRKWLKLSPLKGRGKQDVVEHEPLDLNDCHEKYLKLKSACTNDRDRAIIAVMRYGGLREGEVVGLKKENFKFFDDHCILTFWRPKVKKFSKILLSDPVVELERYVSSVKDGASLWPSETFHGEPLTESGVYRMVKLLASKASLEWYPHMFRHQRATELAKDGLIEKELNLLLGWSDRSRTAMTYTNMSIDDAIDHQKSNANIHVEGKKNSAPARCHNCGDVLEKGVKRCPGCGKSTSEKDKIADIEQKQKFMNAARSELNEDALEAMILKIMKKAMEKKE